MATSQREISPQRLTHYRDNWYLDAWCHLRDELRSFAVDAIKQSKPSTLSLKRNPRSRTRYRVGRRLRHFFLVLKCNGQRFFHPKRARWVAAEHWHPEQQGVFLDDGSYQLRLPYSNDPELIMDILKYGPDCAVLAPEGCGRRWWDC